MKLDGVWFLGDLGWYLELGGGFKSMGKKGF